MQLTAAVAADGGERPGRMRCAVQAPRLAQHRIDERGARVHERLDRLLGEEALFQLFVSAAQELPPGARVRVRGQLRRQPREQRPRRRRSR